MSTRNFVVKNGLTVGNVTISASTGNLVTINANLGNLAIANFFQGDGSRLSNINGGNITGNISGNISNAAHAGTANTVVDNAQPNITSVGTLSSLSVTGNISAGGLLTNNLYYANGSPWDLQLPGGSNTQVQFNDADQFGGSANFTFNKSTNVLTVSGNIGAGNVNAGNLLTANFVTGTLTTNAQPNITSVGNLTSLNVSGNANVGNIGGGIAAFTGNVSGNNLSATNSITAGNGLTVTTGALSVLSGNLDVTGNLNVTGNVNYSNVTDLVVGDPLIFIGANNSGDTYDLGIVAEYNNGSSNIHTGIARNASTDYWTFFDGVTAQPTTVVDWANATYPTVKLGNLIATGTANITANLSAGNVNAGNLLTANYVTGTLTTNAQPNITSVGTLTSLSVTGNVSAGNVSGTDVSGTTLGGTLTTAAQPNVTSVGTLTSLAVTGNASAGNISTAGVITANGNITANYFIGNGSQLTGIDATAIQNGSANVRTFANANVSISAAGNANIVVVTGTGANIAGTLNATGNANVNNLGTAQVLATANVTAPQLISNVATGTAPLVVSSTTQVANLNAATAGTAGTVTTAAQPNITSVGTLSSLSVTGNISAGNVTGGNLVSANYVAGTLTTNAQPNITSVGQLTSLDVSGNIDATYTRTVGYSTDRANVSVSTGTVIDQFSPSDFRTAKYVISASGDDGYQSVETLLVHDGVDAYITIYGSICSNVSADIIDVSANINGVSGNVALYATAGGANVIVNVVASYINT